MRRLVILLIVMAWLQYAVGEEEDKRRTVNSYECVMGRFCTKDRATRALAAASRMSIAESREYVSNYFNKTTSRSCSCHKSCVYFDVCCEDVDEAVKAKIPPRLQPLKGRIIEQGSEAYSCDVVLGSDLITVNTCPSSTPASLKTRCEIDNTNMRRFELKVTSGVSGLTYKNIYCGICNKENITDLVSWVWNFDCKKFRTFEETTSSNNAEYNLIEVARKNNCIVNNTIPTIPGDGDEVHHQIGAYLDSLSLCSSPPVRTCPSQSADSTSRRCSNGPNSLVTVGGKVYKNSDCLECNVDGAMKASALCESCENENCRHSDTSVHENQKSILGSFGILVQPYHSSNMVTCKTETGGDCSGLLGQLPSCGNGQFMNYQTTTCEDICPPDSYYKQGECIFSGVNMTCGSYDSYLDFSQQDMTSNITHILHGRTFKLASLKSTACYNCTYLISSEDHNKIQVTAAGNVYYNGEKISSQFVYRKDNMTFHVCLDQAHVVEEVVTGVLLGISIISLILFFCAFFLLKRLRNVPGKIVAGNMACLLLAYVCFLLRLAVEEYSVGCTIFAVLIHYFLLSSFIFNIVYASFIVHSLEFIDFESSVNHWTAIRMWLLGLMTPLTVVIPALVLDAFPGNEYKPLYGGKECFIMNENGRLIFFIGPIGVCLFVAKVLYVVILIKLVQVAKATSQVRSNHQEKVMIAMKLVIVLGFTWIFAIVAAATQYPLIVTIFIVTCTLQGLFSFLVFICNKATLKDIKKYWAKKASLSLEMSTSSNAKGSSATMSTDLTKTLLYTNKSP